MVTTTFSFPGYEIVDSHGLVCAFYPISDGNFMGKKGSENLTKTYAEAVKRLEEVAESVGGNAVVGVTDKINRRKFGIVEQYDLFLTGTAVTVVKSDESI